MVKIIEKIKNFFKDKFGWKSKKEDKSKLQQEEPQDDKVKGKAEEQKQ